MEAQRPDSSIDIVLDQCFPDEREKTIRPADFDYLLETEDDDETLSAANVAAVADIDNIVKETVAAVANIDGFIKESTDTTKIDILPLDERRVVIDFDDFVTTTADTATNNDGSAAAAAAVVETTATKKKNILDFETTITDDNNQMKSPVDTATNNDGSAAAAVVETTATKKKNILDFDDFETTITDDNNQMESATNNDGSAAAAAAVVETTATTKNILDFETTIIDDNNQMDTATNNDGSAAAAVVETTATKKKNILDFDDFETTIIDDNNQMDTATNNDGSASANARVNIPEIQTITTEENFFNFFVTPNQSSSTFTVETVEEQQYIMHTLDSAVDVSGCFSNESYIILNPALPVATDMEVTTSSADASDSDIISKNRTTTTIKTTCEYKQFIHYGVAELLYVRKLCYKNLHLRSPRSHTIPMALSADDLKSISTDLDKNNDGNFVLGYNDFISKADNAIFETAKFNIPIMAAAAAAAPIDEISFNFPDVIASLRRENVEMKGTYSFNSLISISG
ncbi:uncharacterized protein LOC135849910 isoform X2 [Planococcus citri]|uniref:uncharacterized protein LOC135849910 isoform X2 n=1 Tax=Planococcus citri TaxID=170843 RepID=UPI0031F7D07B